MAASQNGWVANDRTKVASQFVPGTDRKLTVRTDAPGLLLLEVAAAFHRMVEPIIESRGELDDWGYAERPIRGGVSLSNHASGTAIDLNALKHPLGAVNTFTPSQRDQIKLILAATGHVVHWGGNWQGRKDEMHFEIGPGKTMADCEHALSAMRMFNTALTGEEMAKFEDLWTDHYSGRPMMIGDLISWAATHAARANENATAALAEIKAVREEIGQVKAGNVDYAALAKAVADEQSRRMAE